MNTDENNLRWLFCELAENIRATRDFSVAHDILSGLTTYERDKLLRALFLDALRLHDWTLAHMVLEEKDYIATAADDVSDFGPLWSVIANLGDQPDVIEWLIAHGADIERRGSENFTPLIGAAASGLNGCVRVLLERGAKVNASSEIDDDVTALMAAAINGNEPIVRQLLSHGAEVRRTNRWGIDAANLADANKHFAIALLIRDAAAK